MVRNQLLTQVVNVQRTFFFFLPREVSFIYFVFNSMLQVSRLIFGKFEAGIAKYCIEIRISEEGREK